MSPPGQYQFGGIILDVAAMRICRGGEELSLEPKSFRLLQFLIENRDRVLGKEEIFRAVWQERIVSDNALTRAVAQIRKALDDDPRKPRYIDTVPTVGYRFIGVLEDVPAVRPPGRRRLGRSGWWMAAGIAAGITIVAAAGVAFRHSRPKPAAMRISGPVPLTTYRGSEDAPSFSPDGDQVAFQWNGEKQDNYDIYVKTLGSDATPLRLTSDPAPDMWPAWSPDGRTIAFQRYVSPGKTDLMLIPALGGPERRLGEFRLWLDTKGARPAWSADSKWLIVPVAIGTGATLFRVSVDTGEASPILEAEAFSGDVFPALSPDGTTLLYLRHPAFNWGELWSVRVDSSMKAIDTPRRITAEGKLMGAGRWTADGKEIVACAPGGTLRLSADGSSAEPVADLGIGTYINTIAIAPLGNRLAYSIMHGDTNIWRIDLNAKIPHPEPLIASTVRDVYPKYSPDGRKLAFHSNRTGDGSQVWISGADGRNPRQLTFMPPGVTGTAHWSPDGRTITFDSNASGSYQIYAISAEGGRVRQLTTGSHGNFGNTWSQDGKWIYYTSAATGRHELWKMPAGGGPAVQVTRNGSMMGMESPDGKAIYFCKETNPESIWKMPVEGGPEEELVDSLYRANFAVTNRGIYYMTAPGADGTAELKLYSFATGKSSLIKAMGVPEYGLDVSPDGRYLVYAQLDDPASDLMLVENFH